MTDASIPWADACRQLADDPDSRSELMMVAGALQRQVEPCGPAMVVETLAPLLALYGVGKKSESEAEAFWGFYMDALSGVPAEALRSAVAEYVADAKSEWFPKPGPLRALCDRHAIKIRMAASRARKAVELAA